MRILTLFRRPLQISPLCHAILLDPLSPDQQAQHNYVLMHRAAMANERRAVDSR
jgi:hypothetical protein